jgi:hypothetical protein
MTIEKMTQNRKRMYDLISDRTMMARKDFVVNEPTRRCTAWLICECVMTRRFLIFNF